MDPMGSGCPVEPCCFTIACYSFVVVLLLRVPDGLTTIRSIDYFSHNIVNDTLNPVGCGFALVLDECFKPVLQKDTDSIIFSSVTSLGQWPHEYRACTTVQNSQIV